MTNQQARAVVETRLVHNVHRGASTLMAEAAARPAAPEALAEVREFLVSQLRSHHESEDRLLWPLIMAKAPELAGPFAELSGEHDRLDAALDALEAAPIGPSDRTVLAESAVALRDLVHAHLDHEEPVLFPALRDLVTDQESRDFAEQVVAETPNIGPHLLVGFLEQAGTPEETGIILGAIPAPVLGALREQGRATLADLG